MDEYTGFTKPPESSIFRTEKVVFLNINFKEKEKKMEQKPYHINILEKMKEHLVQIAEGFISSKIVFWELGNLLEESKLPKKNEDVCFIVESLEKMIESTIRVETLENTQKYLIDLVEKIRMFFFKNLLNAFQDFKEPIKIILNNGGEKIIIENTLKVEDHFIEGINPEGKETRVYYEHIKLKGGIIPFSTKKEDEKDI